MRHRLAWCGALGGQDVRQRLDVDLVEHALPARLLQAGDELGAQDVDLPVQQAPPVRDFRLLLRELPDLGSLSDDELKKLIDELTQEESEPRSGSGSTAAFRSRDWPDPLKQQACKGST